MGICLSCENPFPADMINTAGHCPECAEQTMERFYINRERIYRLYYANMTHATV